MIDISTSFQRIISYISCFWNMKICYVSSIKAFILISNYARYRPINSCNFLLNRLRHTTFSLLIKISRVFSFNYNWKIEKYISINILEHKGIIDIGNLLHLSIHFYVFYSLLRCFIVAVLVCHHYFKEALGFFFECHDTFMIRAVDESLPRNLGRGFT